MLSVVYSYAQMTNVTPEHVAEIIEKFEVADENKQRGVMGIEGNITQFFCPFSLSECLNTKYCLNSLTSIIYFNHSEPQIRYILPLLH